VSQGHQVQDEVKDEPQDGNWSDLERRFFEAAPPDEPVAPSPALSFEDLEEPGARPVRRAPRRVRRPRSRPSWAQPGLRALAVCWRLFATVFATIFATAFVRVRRAAATVITYLRPAIDRVRAAAAHGLDRAQAAVTRALGPLLSRLADEIPGERLEGRTIVVGLVTMCVVLGLSASVLGSRGNDWLAPPPAAATGASNGAAAAAKCPAEDPSRAFVQPLEPEVRRHVPAAPAAKRTSHAPARAQRSRHAPLADLRKPASHR